MGIGDQSGCEMVLMFGQELLQERGLSHSGHACEHDESCFVEEAVFQCRHREPMSVAPIEKIRVRSERKGLELQMIKGFVHILLLTGQGRRGQQHSSAGSRGLRYSSPD
jgi:hypothetical protein